MIDRCADDGDADRNVDGVIEIEQLHRNVTLIVVHGHDQVITSARCLKEYSIWSCWPIAWDAVGTSCLDGRKNNIAVFPAK